MSPARPPLTPTSRAMLARLAALADPVDLQPAKTRKPPVATPAPVATAGDDNQRSDSTQDRPAQNVP